MAVFSLPQFNLPAWIWHAPGAAIPNPPIVFPDVTVLCVIVVRSYVYMSGFNNPSCILFPKLTDVRDGTCVTNHGWPDVIEDPTSSGRFYQVVNVEDSGKGFANEHRVAAVVKYPPWPDPIP